MMQFLEQWKHVWIWLGIEVLKVTNCWSKDYLEYWWSLNHNTSEFIGANHMTLDQFTAA